ncbi:hypothetical protein pdam_00017853 [Pocillopora damicornis]|uniref:Uncharacterized protein n=1 Tax=Pocillopora damicornis TaxID=46731 RepID=A0A3M6TD55_POCDA|nr:hypothetical protein pdam_00017853 [Pocillopora damicornis]
MELLKATLRMETAANEILTDKTINPLFQRAYNVRGWINARAYEIKHEMALFAHIAHFTKFTHGISLIEEKSLLKQK